jgi:hypothetical protein
MKSYCFKCYLGGEGETPEEAWADAVKTFNEGFCEELPTTYSEEEIEEN